MNMPAEVAQAADALLAVLRNTETFQTYEELKKSVMADEVNRRLLDRFMRAQSALQMAAMAGQQPDSDDMQRFQGITSLLFAKSEVSQYLLAEMRLQQAMADIFKILTEAADLDMDIPGLS